MKTIMFFKPNKSKKAYVQLQQDDNRIFYLEGIDCYNKKIYGTYSSINKAMRDFYFEVGWMLNKKIMTKIIYNTDYE